MNGRLPQALALLPGTAGERDRQVLVHRSRRVEVDAPCGTDTLQPQAQDGLSRVASGSGVFRHRGERIPVRPGDCLFVPARHDHRFEQFTDDFVTWALLWGPQGGESA